jgi:hypothetical protein
MLRLATLFALVMALVCRVECHPRTSAPCKPTTASAVAAASKAATPAVTVQAIKVICSAPFKRTSALSAAAGALELPPHVALARSSARAALFPRILAVRRRIPRLGSEEPPWRVQRV